tara:strand:- start:65 stop:397 length:333 start_codon:yes stop_codon:yes gene_type:complete
MKKNRKKIDMVKAMKKKNRKKNRINDTAKAQQIARLSRKAAQSLANQYPDLNVDVDFFEGFIGAGMWENKDADTYHIRAKLIGQEKIMVLVEPVYGKPSIPKNAKKIVGI